MKLKISKEIKARYPDLKIGVVVAQGVKNRKQDIALEEMKRISEDNLFNSCLTTQQLLEHPFIASWRETYRSFGVKPKDYTPTAESLIRRVLKGNKIPQISVVVDVYLVIEIEEFLPIGGYDLDKIKGDIALRFSSGNENFIPLGGGSKQTKPGEVVYSDDKQVLTVRWNFLDCDETKITLDTTNFILCVEAADLRVPIEAIEEAIAKLQQILEQFCPGQYKSFIVDVSKGLEWDI
ncbi:MAG: phenylalanine--tRNA ligase beta subunit-related protein [bacterium]|nr:phenylalanine--tRNA ligase beta subunit-related protein [bacterium]